MKRVGMLAGALLVAFAAGFGSAHFTPVAAAPVPLTPQLVDIGAMTYAGLAPLAPGGVLHGINLVSEDALTVAGRPKRAVI